MIKSPLPGSGDSEALLDVHGVAARFRVPVSWIYAKAEDGTLPSYKLGKYRRFDAQEVEEFLQAQRQGGEARNGRGR